MNPHHNSNQNPPVPQVNVGGLYPSNSNRPIVAPSGFLNYPNQPFPMQNTTPQFPNGVGGFNPQQTFNPFPVYQFNPSQQQQGQFFPHNSMNPTAYNQNVGLPNEQVVVQNAIQNIRQLLQLQNPNYAQCPPANFPVFQNQIANVMSHQNPGFLANQQFGMPISNGPVQHANQGQQLPNMGQQLQGNQFLPHASGSVQTQQAQNLIASLTNFQNQIAHGVGPQNHSFLTNQMFGMTNSNGPVQGSLHLPHASASVQAQNPCPTLTNFENNHGNVPADVNSGGAESQFKNFTGHKKNDASHKGFKSQFHHGKHVKEKYGTYNGNMNKEGYINAAVHSGPRNSTNQIPFEKKVPSVKYTEQEVKQWREARKKHYPTSVNVEKKCKKEQTLSDVTNQEATLRRQQLKEILTKQAELGCEVADIPSSYLSGLEKQNPRGKKHEREHRFKKGKFNNRRGIFKKTRPGYQNSFNELKEPSLLQKLLARDIKRDKNHLLQVIRFIAVNSFFTDESLRFPSVIVRETVPDVAKETSCSVSEGSKNAVDINSEEEGEITG